MKQKLQSFRRSSMAIGGWSKLFTVLGLVSLSMSHDVVAQCPITQQPTYSSACSSGDYINSFTLAGTPATGMAGCNGQTNNYRSNSSPTWNLTLGQSYTWSFTTGSYAQYLGIWIDLNNNGTYDTNELLATSGYVTSGSGTLTIPTTAVAGSSRRMRVRCSYSTPWSGGQACVNSSYGETEDFFVTLVANSNCSGTPVAGSLTTTGGTTFCGYGNPTFTASGFTSGQGGLTNLWQYSTNGGSTWTTYTGQTSATLSPGTITVNTLVRFGVNCSASGITSYTTPVTITVNPYPTLTSTSGQVTTCTGGSSNTLSVSGNASSYSWSPSTGLNTTSGTSVVASPTTSTVYTVTATNGLCNSTLAIPVNVATMAAVTTTATPAAVCSGSSTQLATTQSPTNYQVYGYNAGLLSNSGATVLISPTVGINYSGNNNDGYSQVTMPFTFSFYGTNYTTMYVSTNGYVGFSTTNMQVSTPQSLPSSTSPDNMICLFHRDLDVSISGSPARITYHTTGTTPNRKFIITYEQVPNAGSAAPWSISNTNTGQIVLNETTNYIDVITDNTPSSVKTSGIENLTGTLGTSPTGRNNATYTVTAPGEAYRYVLPVYTYAWTPSTNLSSATVYNPTASNNTAATTFSVTVTNPYSTCAAAGTAAITINPLPTANINISPDLICSGQSTTINYTGTAGANFYTREGVIALPVQTFGTGGTATYTTPTLTSTTIYTIDSVISTQGCKSYPNKKDTVVVNPYPSAVLGGTQTICNGSTALLPVTVTQGTAPFTVTYTDGLNTYTQTSNTTTFNLAVSPVASISYALTGLTDAFCTAQSSNLTGGATITVKARPTAALSVPASTICNGANQNLTVTFTGTAPYSFTLMAGTQSTSYSGIMSNTYTIPLSISATTTYSITALNDTNCVGYSNLDFGTPLTITVHPRPTSVLSGTATICNGNSTSMNVVLTGAAPWSFNYFDGNSTVAVTNVTTSPYTLTITPANTATYNIIALTDANNCGAYGNEMTGTGNVVVNYSPSIISQTNSSAACAGNQVVLSANVTGTNLVYQWTLNGQPLSNGGVYSGAASSTLTISDITGLGGNIYQLQVSGICPPAVSTTPVTLVENTINQWTGMVSKNWSNPGNWACGVLPTAATDVTITPSAPFQPEVDIPTAICRSLLVYPGSSVKITGTNNGLEVKSDIVNLGTFNASAGKVTLSGTGPQQVPGVVYKRLEIQGGSTKTFSGNAVVTADLALFSGYIALGQNNLTISQNATVYGGGQSSFVITDGTGTVVGENMGAGANTGTVMFPVGSSAFSYTPVSISNSGMADDISVRVIDGVYEDYNGNQPAGAAATTNAVNKTWLIHEAIPGGSNATITPQWYYTDHLTGFDPNSCLVSHYISTNSAWLEGPVGPAAGFNPYTQTMSGVTSFSPFGVSSNGGPLGLSLLAFKGTLQNNDTRLNWTTTNEKDMAVYEVERSLDKGASFEKTGSRPATGNDKAGENSYAYTDASVTGLGAERILYRLKMLDKAGRHSYSNVVAVTTGKEAGLNTINLYPNPVTGNDLFIKLGDSRTDAISVVITDMAGKVITNTAYAAGSYNASAVKVNVSSLPQGIYLLRLLDANDSAIQTLKFNKQ